MYDSYIYIIVTTTRPVAVAVRIVDTVFVQRVSVSINNTQATYMRDPRTRIA